ncbi:hypothetical protein [Pseudalkalibacillus hwajinpoensis]
MDMLITCCGAIGFFLVINLFFLFYTWLAKQQEKDFTAGRPKMNFSF